MIIAAATLSSPARAAFDVRAAPQVLSPGAEVTLARHDIDKRTTETVLTAEADADGSLSLSVDQEPGIFLIKLGDSGELSLAVEAGETVQIKHHEGRLTTAGSAGTQTLAAYETFRKESLARLVYPPRRAIKAAKTRGAPESEIAALTEAEVEGYAAHLKELNDFVIEQAGSSMALYGASLRLDGDYRTGELQNLVEAFAKRHGDIAATQSLETRMRTALRVALGQVAPELTAQNLEGQTESLSDHRGKYILVDFWASWCPPCRLENKHYSDLLAKTGNDRFDLFAVNLDTNEKAWRRAVGRDQANWTQVSDLKGWGSPLADLYGVAALPASFLLDVEGRIIAKDLRGAALDAKLAELGIL